MKHSSLLTVFLILWSVTACADVYLIDKNQRVIDKKSTAYTHKTGMESRGETQITSGLSLDVKDVEVKGGQIVERELTASEKQIKKSDDELAVEEKLIRDRSRKLAIDSLKAEGVTFKRAEI